MFSKVIIPNNFNFGTWNIINDSGGFQNISFWNLKILFFSDWIDAKTTNLCHHSSGIVPLYVFIDTYMSCVTSHGISSNMYNTYILYRSNNNKKIPCEKKLEHKHVTLLIIIFWLRCSAKYSPLHALSPERRSCDTGDGDIWMSSE